MRDIEHATLTGTALLRHPRNFVVIVFFYALLMLFRVCLTSIIKINAVTVMDVSFHWRAMERLYYVRAALTFRDR